MSTARGAAGGARARAPRGRQAGRVVRPGRPHRQPTSSPPASCRCATGQLITTGKVGGEVTAEEATDCAQQCALNALAAVKRRGRRPVRGHARRQGGRLRGIHARLHRPAGVANGASELLGEVFGDAGRHARSAVGVPCCRSMHPSRSSSSSRSPDGSRGVGCPRRSSRQRAGTPTAPSSRSTPRDASTVVLLRDGATGPEVYLLRRHLGMAFAAGMCVFPGGGVDPRDSDARVGWAGPSPREWADAARRATRRRRGRWCAPRCARRSRSPACCWPGRPPTTVVADTTGDDWEADRQALEARELSFTDFLDRRGLVLRTDLLRLWGALDHPGVRAAALRHPVLRRRAARGAA